MRKFPVAAVTALVLAVVLVVPSAWAGGGSPVGAKEGTPRFLITSPHSAEMCLAALDDLSAHAPNLLAKMDFGCKVGDHNGYAIVHAENADAARKMLPESLRAGAKIVELNKFTQEQIKSFHSMK